MSITVLIHSSKTMRSPAGTSPTTTPILLDKAKPLAAYLQTLESDQLQTAMGISESLSRKTHDMIKTWNVDPAKQCLAVDSFVGDIYSGLRASTLSDSDREYAQQHLRILSGLYGVLRPLDGIRPYRLEMGYKLPSQGYGDLYTYWGPDIAATFPPEGLIVNLSAAEYTKTVLPYVDISHVVAPRFLTINPRTGEPRQVIVHTKIARGAFARWLMTSRVSTRSAMVQFSDLGYTYNAALSSASEPTFVCENFGGIGLSVRLQKNQP